MKKTSILTCIGLLAAPGLWAQNSQITYQGRLWDGQGPANGTYDLIFGLFDSDSGGSQVAGPLTNAGVNVVNGLFSVGLDFGRTNFARWRSLAGDHCGRQ